MNRGFAAEIRRVVVFTLLCTLFGLMNGYLTWTLIIGGAVYMVWMLYQIHRLDVWLRQSRFRQPPDASGIWGDVFDSITRLQKRQQREKNLLQSVVRRGQETTAALRDGIILLDNKGNIEWFNEAAKQLLSLRKQDQGHALVNYIRHPGFIQFMEKGDFSESLDLPAPRSEDTRLQYQVTSFGQGECLVIVRDVTRLYKLELMRKDFVANVSHELRTPLTVIRGYVETLGMSPDLPDNWRRALQQMEQQSLRMTALINDLIALSKLETDDNGGNHRALALQPLLQMITNDAVALSGNRDHQFALQCPDDLEVLGSEKELHSAFSNLVFNAVKYSPDNTEVSIKVKQTSQTLEVAIKDQGEGIDPVHLPRLTERFYRVDSSRQSESGGTGLGLAIVKHVLLRHGAKLEIKSQIGQGSTFTCVFPANRIAEAPARRRNPALDVSP
ncbi:phosphate regulon sensor histidine kinase PhoR [Pseudomaricurvus alkylphenolicus]|uniref:phosphate regulon sensor histidine kinase PhoR n=1 Tax=Pseudomaricurvus alkylphenolicus TaxID=1306991 RepID=UPI00141DBEF3|nr:phosphate regulon sensor histidine kinase PhoR [Pseudomaricurvus alkylphenolicus]NIB39446.1 phosphate regulon sensor histidine kinase PhoR [Pseudomaricurvus alkylphenolicus]